MTASAASAPRISAIQTHLRNRVQGALTQACEQSGMQNDESTIHIAKSRIKDRLIALIA
jgi:hypothetical protein